MTEHWADHARALGLNPYHPDTWTERGRAAMMEWKLVRFRAKWKWLLEIGQVALVRRFQGRETLINEVRSDLYRALCAFPTRPYRCCPCHPHRYGLGKPGEDPWVTDRKPGETTTGAALRWLPETFGRK